MKLKNILIIFSFVVVSMGFYSLSNRQKSSSFVDSDYNELLIREESNDLSRLNYNNQKTTLKKRTLVSSQKIDHYKKMVQSKANSQPIEHKNIKNEDDTKGASNESETEGDEEQQQDEKTADAEETSEDEEKSELDSQKIAEKKPSSKNKLKDYESIVASSQDDKSFYIEANTFTPKSNQPVNSESNKNVGSEAVDADSNTENTNTDSSDPTDRDNDRLADIDLSELEALIDESNYSAIQDFLSSSNLSSFKREALVVLVTSSYALDNNEELETIIASNYFTNENLGIYTLSMIQGDYRLEEKIYMGDLLRQDVYRAPGQLTKDEFIEKYFNGVRVHLPTPNKTSDRNLAELYLSIDSSIEESFSTYSSNSQIASE